MALWRSLRASASTLRRLVRRLSLQSRLLLGLLAVATVGLLVADFAVYGQIRSYVRGQASNELVANADAAVRVFAHYQVENVTGRLPLGTAIEVVTQRGQVVVASPANFHLVDAGDAIAAVQSGQTFTLQGRTGVSTATYIVSPRSVGVCPVQIGIFGCPQSAQIPGVALVALPLTQVNDTLTHLLLTEFLVSIAVLAVIGMLGYFVVQVGLRPLTDIEETAGKIAAGDLSRRVARDEESTEVGRLGGALNAMLGTIERSFAAQRASEDRLRRFLADASHELRTPVTSIRGYAELFRRGAAARPEDLAQAMRRIEDEATRMGGLVEDLLLLARLDQGRPLARERVDLSALAIDAAADAQVLAPDREVTGAADEPVVVLGDEARLRQVVGNLVQNALRHTPAGSPVTVAVVANEGRARLSVRDEGPGLPPEAAARVFERFYRADPSRTRASGGAGLGLSIVASIAAAHGGTARVETSLGEGADFIVELPLAGEEPDAPPIASAPEDASGADPYGTELPEALRGGRLPS